jgi:hypothetical protein
MDDVIYAADGSIGYKEFSNILKSSILSIGNIKESENGVYVYKD